MVALDVLSMTHVVRVDHFMVAMVMMGFEPVWLVYALCVCMCVCVCVCVCVSGWVLSINSTPFSLHTS